MKNETSETSLIQKYILPKLKFGLGSLISTGVDYGIFFSLLWANLGLKVSFIQVISLSIGIATNFIIQRNFIFRKERSLMASMGWSLSFSITSVILSGFLVKWLYSYLFFQEYPLLMKLLVTGLFFFFNYYTKQYSFEKKVSI